MELEEGEFGGLEFLVWVVAFGGIGHHRDTGGFKVGGFGAAGAVVVDVVGVFFAQGAKGEGD